jgi:hypothetical protein
MVFSVVDKSSNNGQKEKKKITKAKKDQLKSMLKLENKVRQTTYQEAANKNTEEKRKTEIEDIIRNSVSLGEVDLYDNDKDELCCQQCNTPVPLVCWRFSIKYFLQSTALVNPNAKPKKSTLSFMIPSFAKTLPSEIDDLTPFWVVDGWRESLLGYIENKSGHASRDT